MKALFVHFFDFAPHSGISKKIIYQIDALKACGMDVELCYMAMDELGNQRRFCGETVIDNYGNGLAAKILKWFSFRNLTNYILSHNIKFVYIRSIYNTTPSLLKMLKKLKAADVKVVMEFPTYPYDHETKGTPIKFWPIIYINKIFRNKLKNSLTRIVTFTDYPEIHGVKAINISNGIDFNQIKLKSAKNETKTTFDLIGVAEIHFWHGFDRIINGLAEYYKIPVGLDVHFHIVGDGVQKDVDLLKKLSRDYKIEDKIHFYGNQFGEELDQLFEKADFGVASLARHRSGITNIKTLKNREYAARGIPFIYSEIDDDFEDMPYILKAPADESAIDINGIIDFYRSLKMSPSEIRDTIAGTLSWNVQMQKVIDETFKKQ